MKIFPIIISVLLAITFLSLDIQAQNKGVRDPGFGLDGRAKALSPADAVEIYDGRMVLQDNGYIVVQGKAKDANGQPSYFLSRLTPIGLQDFTFGSGGLTEISIVHVEDTILNMLQQPNGRIVLYGFYKETENSPEVIRLRGFTPQGGIDVTYGNNGVVEFTVPFFSNHEAVRADIAADGSIYVGGHCWTDTGFRRAYVGKVTPEGQLDSGFGTDNGFIFHSIENNPQLVIRDLKIFDDGTVVLAANICCIDIGVIASPALIFLNPDGSLNSNYGNGGKWVNINELIGYEANFNYMRVYEVKGKVYISGSGIVNNGIGTSTAIVCLNQNGTLNFEFGDSNGYILFEDTYLYLLDHMLALQDDNILAVATYHYTNKFANPFLALINDQGEKVTPFGEEGIYEQDFSALLRVHSVLEDDNGGILFSGYERLWPYLPPVYELFVTRLLNDDISTTESKYPEPGIKLWPNPFNSYLYLENLPSEAYQVRLTDILGRQINTWPLDGSESAVLDLPAGLSGIYSLLIMDRNGDILLNQCVVRSE